VTGKAARFAVPASGEGGDLKTVPRVQDQAIGAETIGSASPAPGASLVASVLCPLRCSHDPGCDFGLMACGDIAADSEKSAHLSR
jgi:hypothetical protein